MNKELKYIGHMKIIEDNKWKSDTNNIQIRIYSKWLINYLVINVKKSLESGRKNIPTSNIQT